ncbi:MAG: isocitrate lyase/phosphoenolpyruvate mutase family protein [Acidimicrobiales bacterium]
MVDELAGIVEPVLVATTGPRYFGIVVGGALDAANAADLMGQGQRSLRAPGDYVLESSRRARDFATWAALRQLGRSGVTELADCLFGPGLVDPDAIAELVVASPLPLNVMLAPGRGPSIEALGALGVRRISVGSLIAHPGAHAAASLAGQLAEGVTPECTGTLTLAYAQLQGLMQPADDRR